MKRNGVCMWGRSHGGRGSFGYGMSCAPMKLRRYVKGNTSPGTDMNDPSPIRKNATSLLASCPEVDPLGAGGISVVQLFA